MDVLFSIAIAMVAGLLMSRVVKPFGLPAVTGYLVAGILVGPYCLGALGNLLGISFLGFSSMEYAEGFGVISDVALGFIAFSIGNEFRLSQLKQTGKQAAVIGVAQAFVTTLVVDVVLVALSFLLGEEVFPLPAAIILGAVATATAPAATLMVVRQYKAKGKLTDLLLPIVALDDAVGLVVFAVSFGVAKAMIMGNVDLISILLNPLLEIVCSLLLGALMGLLFNQAEKLFHSRSKRLSVSVAFVILTVALTMIEIPLGAAKIAFSPLLTCMMLGTVFCNVCNSSEELMDRVDRWTTPLFILFFVLSGAELELGVFTQLAIVGVGVAYILSRSFGKILGASISAKAVGCDPLIVKHLGTTLLPQAGVALGMSVTVMQLGGPGAYVGEIVRNIVLFSVLIYELVGPMLTKRALMAAGEIIPEHRKSAKILNTGRHHREHHKRLDDHQ